LPLWRSDAHHLLPQQVPFRTGHDDGCRLPLFGGLVLIFIRQSMGYTGFTTTLALIISGEAGSLRAQHRGGDRGDAPFILISKERGHALAKVLTRGIIGAPQFITMPFSSTLSP